MAAKKTVSAIRISSFFIFLFLLLSVSLNSMQNRQKPDETVDFYVCSVGKFNVYSRCKRGSKLEQRWIERKFIIKAQKTAASPTNPSNTP